MGQPIVAAAGFQPALAGCEDSRMARPTNLLSHSPNACRTRPRDAARRRSASSRAMPALPITIAVLTLIPLSAYVTAEVLICGGGMHF